MNYHSKSRVVLCYIDYVQGCQRIPKYNENLPYETNLAQKFLGGFFFWCLSFSAMNPTQNNSTGAKIDCTRASLTMSDPTFSDIDFKNLNWLGSGLPLTWYSPETWNSFKLIIKSWSYSFYPIICTDKISSFQ